MAGGSQDSKLATLGAEELWKLVQSKSPVVEDKKPGGRPPLNFFVATDGSSCGRRAFDLALKYLVHAEPKNAVDVISVCHVYDPLKAFLPQELSREALTNEYETELISHYPKKLWQLNFVQRSDAKQSISSLVEQESNAVKADYLVIGFSGRKGKEPTASVLGSNSRRCLRMTHATTIVVKAFGGIPEPGKARYLVAMDESILSVKAFMTALQLCGPGDTITGLHVDCADNPQEARRVSGVLESLVSRVCDSSRNKVTVEVICLGDEAKSSGGSHRARVIDRLISYVNESEFDFVCVGADGVRGALKSDSVSEAIIVRAKSSIIVSHK
eukprot:GHVT01007339.1.p1 GENE.GHVT01007339.1~~GHVT01007339.1.p1  ORF type:complete len:328 (-),score=18.19 GHVT01007339.1:967-1950(-)